MVIALAANLKRDRRLRDAACRPLGLLPGATQPLDSFDAITRDAAALASIGGDIQRQGHRAALTCGLSAAAGRTAMSQAPASGTVKIARRQSARRDDGYGRGGPCRDMDSSLIANSIGLNKVWQ